MSKEIVVTLSNLLEQLAKMPTLTGKQASAYICGAKTYVALKSACGVKESCIDLTIDGAKIYPSRYSPDDGKFYPADYIESRPIYPMRFDLRGNL